jgi:hypothetical protein
MMNEVKAPPAELLSVPLSSNSGGEVGQGCQVPKGLVAVKPWVAPMLVAQAKYSASGGPGAGGE